MRTFLTRGTLLLLLCFPSPAMACLCHGGGGPYKNVRESAEGDVDGFLRSSGDRGAIFEGVVEKQTIESEVVGGEQIPYRVVTIRTSRVYHGPQQAQFVVKTGVGGGDCGFDFETGEKYLVFAIPEKSGELYTGSCSPTRLIEDSGPILRVLHGDPPAPDDLLSLRAYFLQWAAKSSKICGKVVATDGKPVYAQIRYFRQRQDGFPVRPGWAESDGDGTFCATYLRSGAYLLRADKFGMLTGKYTGPTKRWYLHWLAKPIQLEGGQTVSGITIILHRESFLGPLPKYAAWVFAFLAFVFGALCLFSPKAIHAHSLKVRPRFLLRENSPEGSANDAKCSWAIQLTGVLAFSTALVLFWIAIGAPR